MSQVDEHFGENEPQSVNELLLQDWLRHAHRMERVTENDMRTIERFLKLDVLPDLMGKLTSRLERIRRRGFDAGIFTTQRYDDLRETLISIVDDGLGEAAKRSLVGMREAARYEARWQAASLDRHVGEIVTFNAKLPDPQVLRGLVSERPVAGFNVGEWWDKLTVDTADRIEQQVRIGLAEGETVPQIAARITGDAEQDDGGVFEITSRHAKAIVGNGQSAAMTHAREEVYKANSDIVKETQWIATFDTRTCPKCASLHGQKFPIGEGPMPPAHPPGPSGGRCRCTRNPITVSYEELFARRGKRIVRKGNARRKMRATMDGLVPRDMTYEEWLRTLDRKDLEDALGRKRAGLFSKGEVSFGRMVDQSGRLISLDRLAEMEGIEL